MAIPLDCHVFDAGVLADDCLATFGQIFVIMEKKPLPPPVSTMPKGASARPPVVVGGGDNPSSFLRDSVWGHFLVSVHELDVQYSQAHPCMALFLVYFEMQAAAAAGDQRMCLRIQPKFFKADGGGGRSESCILILWALLLHTL